jgi:O-antigen ligase
VIRLIRRWTARPGWPLAALLCLYPLWWALGIGAFAFLFAAVPMAFELRRRRPLVLPPAFGLWLLFLGWTALSLTMVPLEAPNTSAGGSAVGHAIGILFRLAQFGAVTIIAVYVVNLRQDEVSQRDIMRWLSILFAVTVAGGFLALAAPHLSFTSPLEAILPHSIASNRYVSYLVHPASAEVQSVLGYSAPRPAAPWGYTNFWGNNLSILIIWLCAYMWRPNTALRRLALFAILTVSLVPIVYSLNRGLWFGLILSVLYMVYRFARTGDLRGVLVILLAMPVAIVAFLATPLHDIVSQRASHSGSENIRAFADKAAINGALDSPILGWGGTRKTIGSSQSISVGPSPRCPNCGSVGIGSTGEFWEIAFTTGLVGVLIYFAYFIAAFWQLRRDRSPTGSAARLIILLAIFYSYFYNSLPGASALTFISIAMAWRTVVQTAAVTATAPKRIPTRRSWLIDGATA